MKLTWPAKFSIKSCVMSTAFTGLWLSSLDVSAASLEDSILMALGTNPDVGVVQANRQAIDQELRQARALYMPSIDLRAAAGPEYTNSLATRGRATRASGGDASSTLTRMESQLTLTQMLFDGYATTSEVERQLARTDLLPTGSMRLPNSSPSMPSKCISMFCATRSWSTRPRTIWQPMRIS